MSEDRGLCWHPACCRGVHAGVNHETDMGVAWRQEGEMTPPAYERTSVIAFGDKLPRVELREMAGPAAPTTVEMDCYDAIEIVAQRPDHPSRLLAETARKVADLWNDPPSSVWESEQVREVFPALADALDELLGGGPTS